jgi:carboxyl-terminal processing protease
LRTVREVLLEARWCRRLFLIVALLAAGGLVRAAEPDLAVLRRQAADFEHQAAWDKACEVYERILGRDRNLPQIRERYRVCLRHAACVRRLEDPTFRDQFLRRGLALAVKVYGEVLAKLRTSYVDNDRAEIARLFRYGVEELRLALADATFRREFLADVSPAALAGFDHELQSQWSRKETLDVAEAEKQAVELALAAQKAIGLKPAVAVVELACGACSGLDEYTLFLSPAQLGEEYACLDGRSIQVGLEISSAAGNVLIAHVVPASPSALAGLRAGDRLIAIDGRNVTDQSIEEITRRLIGPEGSEVQLAVAGVADGARRTVKLTRQAQAVPSVFAEMVDRQTGIGYCRVSSFHRGTPSELDQAILQLKGQGMRLLIMDLRRNGGGLFQPAVQTAERFLASGIIVMTKGQMREQNRTYRANNPQALTMPLLLLIDGETASSAEMVAGALKDHERATLFGQPTYGKGSIQGVLPLEEAAGGIRVTLARFFSPLGVAYQGNGVAPHILVPQTPLSRSDQVLEIAIAEARRLAPLTQ